MSRFEIQYHEPGIIIVDTSGKLDTIPTTHETACEIRLMIEGEYDGNIHLQGDELDDK